MTAEMTARYQTYEFFNHHFPYEPENYTKDTENRYIKQNNDPLFSCDGFLIVLILDVVLLSSGNRG